MIFKIIVFTLFLNLFAGLMIDITGLDPGFQPDAQMQQQMSTLGNKTVNSLPVQDQVNWFYGFLDFIGLGILKNFLDTITLYLFGITTILKAVLPMPDSMPFIIALRVIIGTLYGFALISMFPTRINIMGK